MIDRNQKKTDAKFLTDNFGIVARRAAEMVEENDEAAESLSEELQRDEVQADHLADVPVPGSDKDKAHIEEGVEDLEKPVDHRDSAPT